MLHRQALKKMLELKLPAENVVCECGTDDSRTANEGGVIIPCTGIAQETDSCHFVPLSAWSFQPQYSSLLFYV